jgi:large conductance mechanosensitive channel
MKKFINEFKEFISRGNAMDMAVGVIIGGAFTAIVTSLNSDIITPILAIFGGVDFSDLTVKLGLGESAPVLRYGSFITAVINFLITAFIIFCLVKGLNKLSNLRKHDEPAPEVTTKECPYCMSKISIKATRCPHCTSNLDA